MPPAKKATKKAAKKLDPEYVVTSDRCVLGPRGTRLRLANAPRSLVLAGHLTPAAADKDAD